MQGCIDKDFKGAYKMMYRPLKNEIALYGDYVVDDRFGLTLMTRYHCMIGEKVGDTDATGYLHYFRPIRDVDDLTDEEWDAIKLCGITREDTKSIARGFDEIRSRPKETEKERWIRETHDRCKKIPSQWDFTDELAKTWDAAYEAGRKVK
jgi:hypothetical protein